MQLCLQYIFALIRFSSVVVVGWHRRDFFLMLISRGCMQPLAASPCADIFRACQLQLKVEGIYCLFNRKLALCAKMVVFRSSVSVELRPAVEPVRQPALRTGLVVQRTRFMQLPKLSRLFWVVVFANTKCKYNRVKFMCCLMKIFNQAEFSTSSRYWPCHHKPCQRIVSHLVAQLASVAHQVAIR